MERQFTVQIHCQRQKRQDNTYHNISNSILRHVKAKDAVEAVKKAIKEVDPQLKPKDAIVIDA